MNQGRLSQLIYESERVVDRNGGIARHCITLLKSIQIYTYSGLVILDQQGDCTVPRICSVFHNVAAYDPPLLACCAGPTRTRKRTAV